LIRFNAGTESTPEELVKGKSRAIITELKWHRCEESMTGATRSSVFLPPFGGYDDRRPNQDLKSDQQILISARAGLGRGVSAEDLPFIRDVLADEFVATTATAAGATAAKELALARVQPAD